MAKLGRDGGDGLGWGADEGLRARSRLSEGRLGNGVHGCKSENDE